MAFAAPMGYSVEDLDWLRAEIGVAHLELDPWGSLMLSKAMAVTFEVHDFVADQFRTANNVIEVAVDDQPLRLDLSSLAGNEPA